MSDDLVARLCSPEETVFPAGTKIVLDDGKTMELLEPFSMWSSSSDKTDAAVEIVLLRVENDHLKQARSDALAGGDALRDEITRLRAGLQRIVEGDGFWDAPSLARDLLEGKDVT
jgi:ABC-type hemin transport system ATPase subunit